MHLHNVTRNKLEQKDNCFGNSRGNNLHFDIVSVASKNYKISFNCDRI